ncbi:hypothetical protein [Azonexus hydrophilus]|uniref:Uncharacterized protein n=1 Tax=Azonexus hydrophilus TaxID=418702 RepID=A0ABZ2XPR2_9RHOO
MSFVTITTAQNSESADMRFVFSPTNSWQAFAVLGLPERLGHLEGKGLSLAKAVETWNLAVRSRKAALQVASVSAKIRAIINAERDAKKAASKTQIIPASMLS